MFELSTYGISDIFRHSNTKRLVSLMIVIICIPMRADSLKHSVGTMINISEYFSNTLYEAIEKNQVKKSLHQSLNARKKTKGPEYTTLYDRLFYGQIPKTKKTVLTNSFSSINQTFFQFEKATAWKNGFGAAQSNNNYSQEKDVIIEKSEEGSTKQIEKEGSFSSNFFEIEPQTALAKLILQNDSLLQELVKGIERYNEHKPIEKTYLHIDRNLYSAGEDLWYSGFTVLGSKHLPSIASKVLHIDLIGPQNELLISHTQRIINGRSYGSLKLPKSLASGKYRLRAFTDWMRNFDQDFFFYRTITVVNNQNKLKKPPDKGDWMDLQFFPEGGEAVKGLIGKVAFKTIGKEGTPKKIQGHIQDQEGNICAYFNTLADGSGFFAFTPRSNGKYTAVLDDGGTYTFPEIMNKGYVMTVDNVGQTIQVTIRANMGSTEKNLYLLGRQRNRIHYLGKFQLGGKKVIHFEIPKNDIPNGVMTLTLLDDEKKVWCERSLFIDIRKDLSITAKIEKTKFENKEKIELKVHVEDGTGHPISTDLSMAVINAEKAFKNRYTSNILTWLLLESDIKGRVSQPGSLLKDHSWATKQRLDMVMLTHGWRKFEWKEIWNRPDVPKYNFQQGITLSGTALTPKGKPLANTRINLLGKAKNGVEVATANTDEKGHFSMKGINLSDSIKIALSAFDLNNKKVLFKAQLEKERITPPRIPLFESTESEPSVAKEEVLKLSALEKRYDSTPRTDNLIELDEVVVMKTKEKNKRKPVNSSTYGITPDVTIYTEKSTINIVQMLKRVPGLAVQKFGFENYIHIRDGVAPPLWVVDGSPFEVSSSIPSVVDNLDISLIERIEVLKGGSAAIYGTRGSGGVILVYTKQGGGYATETSALDFTIYGHNGSKEFKAPEHNVGNKSAQSNNGTTLYWNPSISTNENGDATIVFFNSDTPKKIQVSIEGISSEGLPGAYLKTFDGN